MSGKYIQELTSAKHKGELLLIYTIYLRCHGMRFENHEYQRLRLLPWRSMNNFRVVFSYETYCVTSAWRNLRMAVTHLERVQTLADKHITGIANGLRSNVSVGSVSKHHFWNIWNRHSSRSPDVMATVFSIFFRIFPGHFNIARFAVLCLNVCRDEPCLHFTKH